jgi:HlyD family secretion protein
MTQVPSHQRVVRLPVPASHSPRRIGPGRRLAAEFQPDAVELEEQQPANASRLTLYAVAALIAAAAFWASFSEFDDVVTAPGRLLTTAPSLVVQPFESSVIRSIDAHVGDVVKAGARLAILDPTFAEADVTQLRTRLASASAQVDRLEAELGGGAYRLGPNSSSEARLQSQLFAERRAYYDAQLASFDQRVEHARSAIATAQSDIGVLATQLEIVRDI